MRILLAEDDELTCDVVKQMLRRGGHTVQVATDGLQALGMLQHTQYDIALIDCHMPEMDGTAVIDAFNANVPSKNDNISFYLISASSSQELEDYAHTNRIRLLYKPFGKSTLNDLHINETSAIPNKSYSDTLLPGEEFSPSLQKQFVELTINDLTKLRRYLLERNERDFHKMRHRLLGRCRTANTQAMLVILARLEISFSLLDENEVKNLETLINNTIHSLTLCRV